MKKQNKTHHDNRTKNYATSLYEEEYDKIEIRRHEAGLTKAEFTRQALKTGKIIARINDEVKAQLNGLRNIRNNINQIARALNSGEMRMRPEVKEIRDMIYDLDDKISTIYNELTA